MRLMVVAARGGQLAQAARLADERGADIVYADGVEEAIKQLSIGDRADVVLIDAELAITDLGKKLKNASHRLPLIACGPSATAGIARDAMHAGASEYLPLPTGVLDVAALIEALARDDRTSFQHVTGTSSIH